MNDLLQLAIEAHGGLERWSQLTNVKASLSVTGNLWQLKAQPDAPKGTVIEAQVKCQQLTTQLIGTNRGAVFTPDRVLRRITMLTRAIAIRKKAEIEVPTRPLTLLTASSCVATTVAVK